MGKRKSAGARTAGGLMCDRWSGFRLSFHEPLFRAARLQFASAPGRRASGFSRIRRYPECGLAGAGP
jgi:hypothetical protein